MVELGVHRQEDWVKNRITIILERAKDKKRVIEDIVERPLYNIVLRRYTVFPSMALRVKRRIYVIIYHRKFICITKS